MYSVVIRLNAKHKRVFALDASYTREHGEQLLHEMVCASNFWSIMEFQQVSDSRFQINVDEEGAPSLLGQGSFGKVYKVLDSANDNRVVAIKQITKDNMTMLDYIQVKEEVEILRVLAERSSNSSRVIQLYGSFEDGDNMFVVMEYFPGDTLFKWVINQH